MRKARDGVSIPHRYARNLILGHVVAEHHSVSIPHRYARNIISGETTVCCDTVSIPHRYARNGQTKRCFYYYMIWFQFLIGTLETLVLVFRGKLLDAVSIPHRYARNAGTWAAWGTVTMVSIPHRYARNVSLALLMMLAALRFNSS